jgi:hypothetical protein
MLSFRQWLLEDAGVADSASMNNVAADDPFKQLRSKYMSGNIPQRKRTCFPDKVFGKNKKNPNKEKIWSHVQ